MNVLFRLDCDRNIGTGHLFRCRQLADFFRGKGWDIHFLVNDYEFTENAVKEYAHNKIKFADIESEIKATIDILGKDAFDIIIVDFVDKTENDELMSVFAKHARQRVVAITDDTKKVAIKANVLLATHPRQNLASYSGDEQEILAGEKYFIVAEEFIENNITVKNRVHNVLISFGGHDPYNVAYDIAKYLLSASQTHDLSKVNFNFLIGGIYKHENQLRNLLRDSSLRCTFHKSLPSVVPMFLENDLAVSACGNTLFELCNLGMPVIGIGLNDRQHEAGISLQDKNLIQYAGFYAELTQVDFNNMFITLFDSYEARLNLFDRNVAHFNSNPLKEIYSVLEGGKYEAKG